MGRVLSMVLFCTSVACTGTESAGVFGTGPDSELARIEVASGSAEEATLLAFLNSPLTTVDYLDRVVALDARAAASLAQHRLGPDGQWGTDDDQPFGQIGEVDEQYWVGAAAIERLYLFAVDTGWEEPRDGLLGTYDAVPFTLEEAYDTLILVNTASEATLDVDCALDRRAVDSILAARPVSSIRALADLYFVGKSALEHLRDFAIDSNTEPEPEPVCEPNIVWRNDEVANDYTTLLAAATTMDAPWAEVLPLSLTGCEDWSDPAATNEVARQLWNTAFFMDYDDPELTDRYKQVDPVAVGGTEFLRMLDRSLVVIDEFTADGDWDPATHPNGALYDARFELVDALADGVSHDPGSYLELRLYFDMVECSQEAVALFDTRSGAIWMIHEFSHC